MTSMLKVELKHLLSHFKKRIFLENKIIIVNYSLKKKLGSAFSVFFIFNSYNFLLKQYFSYRICQ